MLFAKYSLENVKIFNKKKKEKLKPEIKKAQKNVI